MSKPRTCPHCGYILPVSHGFTFDEDLNLICSKCGKIVYPAVETDLSATDSAEKKLDSGD